MDRQRSWTVSNVGGGNRDWRLVATIGNLAYARVKIDVVEASINPIFRNTHDAFHGCRKISHGYRVIVRVKCEIFDPLVSEIRMKIGILVRCWKSVSRSEERRVGKECSSRLSSDHSK